MPRCPTCTTEVPARQSFCGQCGADVRQAGAATETSIPVAGPDRGTSAGAASGIATSGVGRLSSPDGADGGRFLPGTVIAGRYRILGLLGHGGMGEVYRADDLKLDQAVALKFLPAALEQSADRRERFLNEVRVARQVSHANVCRVYDIGEYQGRHFLSMEFVDGEDLSSSLRRMGRMSTDRALQVARQLCAGLAAAHARGIVHRDLKPGNVMIDAGGQVRITDFGLAGLADAFRGDEIRVGTPAYMAPEQLAGREVTPRSDLYSLGLVLYELFTGRAAFDAPSMSELKRVREENVLSEPSTVVPDIDATVERLILRCLEKDPARRPASALAVAAALPGGDPLAAALEAGETPSPEMVADAGDAGGLRAGTAFLCLAALLLGVGALVVLSERVVAPRRYVMEKPPAALEADARELIRTAGYANRPADSMFGYAIDTDYTSHVRRERTEADRWRDVGTVRPSTLWFWYRESPRPLVPLRSSGSASFGNPPMELSGMVRVRLDPQGRLLELLAVPPERWPEDGEPDESPRATEPDWAPLLAAAGLDPARLTAAPAVWNPLVSCDRRTAWKGSYAEQPDVPIRVEAGSFGGKPVFFRVVPPWARPNRMGAAAQDTPTRVANVVVLTLLCLVVVGAAVLAYRNLRRGRGDKRGAFVMGAYIFFIMLAAWVLRAHHVTSFSGETGMLVDALQGALLGASLAWVVYVALEPFVRRRWPHALIAWSRLLTGRLRDPLVGRDLLVGSLAGVYIAVAIVLSQMLPGLLGRPGLSPIFNSVATLSGVRQVAGLLLGVQPNAMIAPIAVFFLIFLLRLVLKRDRVAVGVAFAIMSVIQGLQIAPAEPLGWVVAALIWGTIISIIVRLGLLAATFTFVYANLLLALPLTSDLSAWYAGRAWLGVAVLVCVTVYGFYLSLAGREILTDPLLQDA